MLLAGGVKAECFLQLDAEQLASGLTLKEFEVLLLHGDMGQSERNKVITMFKKQEVNVLVATDVAGISLCIDFWYSSMGNCSRCTRGFQKTNILLVGKYFVV